MPESLRTPIALAALALLLAAGSARAMPETAAEPVAGAPMTMAGPPVDDPFERVNRGLYGFNKGLDRAIVRPLAIGYRRILPQPVRHSVRNGLNNLAEPNTLINDLLQGRPQAGGTTAARFVVNSTIGVAGLFDVAGQAMNLPIHYSDFGQTMGRYGVLPGPYIYMPLLGPSTLRDSLGRAVDSVTGILSIHDLHVSTGERLGVAALDGLDKRAEYDEQLQAIDHTATDPYAMLRSLYLQSRAASIANGDKGVQDLPDFGAPTEGSDHPAANASPTSPPNSDRPG